MFIDIPAYRQRLFVNSYTMYGAWNTIFAYLQVAAREIKDIAHASRESTHTYDETGLFLATYYT